MYVGPKSAAYLHNCTFQANQAVSGKTTSFDLFTTAHLPQAVKQQGSGRLTCCPCPPLLLACMVLPSKHSAAGLPCLGPRYGCCILLHDVCTWAVHGTLSSLAHVWVGLANVSCHVLPRSSAPTHVSSPKVHTAPAMLQ